MDVLDKINLSDKDFLNLTKLGQNLSKLKLNDPTAIKENLEFKLDLFKLEKSSNNLKLHSSSKLSHSIQLFNNKQEDKDESNIIDVDNVKSPILHFDPQNPVLKYGFSFEVDNGFTGKFNGLNFGIKSGSKIRSLTYLKHNANEKVGPAIISDYKNMSFALVLSDVQSLKVDEAVAFETDASLGFELEFDFEDVFSAGLTGFTDLLKSDQLISLDFNIGGKIGVSFSVDDSFKIVFAKLTGNTYRVSVQKSKSSKSSGSLAFGVEVGFSKPGLVSGAVKERTDNILEGLTSLSPGELIEIEGKLKEIKKGKIGFEDLSESETEIVQILVDRLEIDIVVDKATALLDSIGKFRTEAYQRIEKAAKEKLKIGFTYEYQRIETETLLLQLVIPSTTLKSEHANLIVLNPYPLLQQAKKDNKIIVENYLKESSINITRKWGLVIGLGKFKIGGMDKKEVETKVSYNIDNHQKVSFEGIREYKEVGALGGYNQKWWVAFNASMEDYSDLLKPTMREFDFGFSLIFEHFEKRFKPSSRSERDKFLTLMELAILWNIIPESEFIQKSEELWHKFNSCSNLTLSFKLNLRPEGFEQIISQWLWLLRSKPETNLRLMSRTFGFCMPIVSGYEFRTNRANRADAYGALWYQYFKNEGFDLDVVSDDNDALIPNYDYRNYARMAADFLRDKDPALAEREERYIEIDTGDNIWFGGLTKINPTTAKQWSAFINGLYHLLINIESNSGNANKIIKSSFQRLQSIWAQSLHVKAFGTYIVELAKTRMDIMQDIESVLEITYSDTEGDQKMTVLKKS